MKKKVTCLALVAILLVVAVPVFANEYSNDIPYSATVYGAGTCHYGFTTSRYLTKGSGWNDTILVSSTYVIWDDFWNESMYELVQARNGNVALSNQEMLYTGRYAQDIHGTVTNPTTNKEAYAPYVDSLTLYSNAENYSKIYLRIDKPNAQNPANNNEIISNMKVWGYFWK